MISEAKVVKKEGLAEEEEEEEGGVVVVVEVEESEEEGSTKGVSRAGLGLRGQGTPRIVEMRSTS